MVTKEYQPLCSVRLTYFCNSNGYLWLGSPEWVCTPPQTSCLAIDAIKYSFQCFYLHGWLFSLERERKQFNKFISTFDIYKVNGRIWLQRPVHLFGWITYYYTEPLWQSVSANSGSSTAGQLEYSSPWAALAQIPPASSALKTSWWGFTSLKPVVIWWNSQRIGDNLSQLQITSNSVSWWLRNLGVHA